MICSFRANINLDPCQQAQSGFPDRNIISLKMCSRRATVEYSWRSYLGMRSWGEKLFIYGAIKQNILVVGCWSKKPINKKQIVHFGVWGRGSTGHGDTILPIIYYLFLLAWNTSNNYSSPPNIEVTHSQYLY